MRTGSGSWCGLCVILHVNLFQRRASYFLACSVPPPLPEDAELEQQRFSARFNMLAPDLNARIACASVDARCCDSGPATPQSVRSLVIRSQVRQVGRRRLALDLSCRRRGDTYFVVTDRWQRFSELAVDEASLASLADSCDEFLVRLSLQ